MDDGQTGERDPILVRLELYLNGDSVEDSQVQVTRFAEDDPDAVVHLTERELAELACRLYESRRQRARFISASLLGEPVWDMLLALYCFTSRGRRLSISSLCFASGVPQTTALRWVGVMEERGLVSRFKDKQDGRRWYMTLAVRGREVMEQYLRSIHARFGATLEDLSSL